jgi:hypothetical protein
MIDDGLQPTNVRLQAELRPVSIGQACAVLVIKHDRMMASQRLVEGTPGFVFPV